MRGGDAPPIAVAWQGRSLAMLGASVTTRVEHGALVLSQAAAQIRLIHGRVTVIRLGLTNRHHLRWELRDDVSGAQPIQW